MILGLNAFERLVDYRGKSDCWNNSVYSCDTLATRSTPMTSRILERLSLRKGNKVWDEGKWTPNLDGNGEQSLNSWRQSSQLSQGLSTHSLLQMEAARPQIMEKRWNSAFQGLVER